MFIVCGEALFDFFLSLGSDQDDPAYEVGSQIGGSPFNISIGLSRLGQTTAFMGGISTDFLGDQLLKNLEKEKVLTDFVQRVPFKTPISLIQKDCKGIPSYSFYGGQTADHFLDLDQVEFAFKSNNPCHQVKGIHIGSYPLVISPASNVIFSFLEKFSTPDVLVSLDPNVRIQIEPNTEIWHTQLTKFLPFVNILKISDEDIRLLYGSEVNPEEVVENWLKRYPKIKLAALTYGDKGTVLWASNVKTDLIPIRKVDVIDTVGAGDTFQASILNDISRFLANNPEWCASIQEKDLAYIGKRAVIASSITCSRKGANLPKLEEVNRILETI